MNMMNTNLKEVEAGAVRGSTSVRAIFVVSTARCCVREDVVSRNSRAGLMLRLVVLTGVLFVACAGPAAVGAAQGLMSEAEVVARAPEYLRGVMSEVVAVAPGPEMVLDEVVVAAGAPGYLRGVMPEVAVIAEAPDHRLGPMLEVSAGGGAVVSLSVVRVGDQPSDGGVN
jgi:hypothetical protein